MTVPSFTEAVEIVRKLGLYPAFSPEVMAEFGIRFMREALAATQEPARFDGEKAIAEFEAKHPRPNWLQGDNETIREWREGDPIFLRRREDDEGFYCPNPITCQFPNCTCDAPIAGQGKR